MFRIVLTSGIPESSWSHQVFRHLSFSLLALAFLYSWATCLCVVAPAASGPNLTRRRAPLFLVVPAQALWFCSGSCVRPCPAHCGQSNGISWMARPGPWAHTLSQRAGEAFLNHRADGEAAVAPQRDGCLGPSAIGGGKGCKASKHSHLLHGAWEEKQKPGPTQDSDFFLWTIIIAKCYGAIDGVATLLSCVLQGVQSAFKNYLSSFSLPALLRYNWHKHCISLR